MLCTVRLIGTNEFRQLTDLSDSPLDKAIPRFLAQIPLARAFNTRAWALKDVRVGCSGPLGLDEGSIYAEWPCCQAPGARCLTGESLQQRTQRRVPVQLALKSSLTRVLGARAVERASAIS